MPCAKQRDDGAGKQEGTIVVSAALTCQQDAQGRDSAPSSDKRQPGNSTSAPEQPSGRLLPDQPPTLRLLADDAVQTVDQDDMVAVTESATQTAFGATLVESPAQGLLAAMHPPQRRWHSQPGVPEEARPGVALHCARQGNVPGRLGSHPVPISRPGSGYRPPVPAKHMVLPRPPPQRTQHDKPVQGNRSRNPTLRLAEHSAHGATASPRGWHQQWRMAAYAQHSQRAPSSRGHGSEQLAETVAAEYDALERHMDAVRLRRQRQAARPRGLEPISERSASRPRSTGSTLRTPTMRRQQQHLSVPPLRQLPQRLGAGASPRYMPGSPRTPTGRSQDIGLPSPSKAYTEQTPHPIAAAALPAATAARSSAQDSASQTERTPSPIASADSAMLNDQHSAALQEAAKGRQSMLGQLQSALHLADAISERLGAKLADETAAMLPSVTEPGQSFADRHGTCALSEQHAEWVAEPESSGNKVLS